MARPGTALPPTGFSVVGSEVASVPLSCWTACTRPIRCCGMSASWYGPWL